MLKNVFICFISIIESISSFEGVKNYRLMDITLERVYIEIVKLVLKCLKIIVLPKIVKFLG